MAYDSWTAYQLAKERMKDTMREAQQKRLIRVVQGHRRARSRRPWGELILSSLLDVSTGRRVDARPRRPPSTASRPALTSARAAK
jgi:hypothetical protein